MNQAFNVSNYKNQTKSKFVKQPISSKWKVSFSMFLLSLFRIASYNWVPYAE